MEAEPRRINIVETVEPRGRGLFVKRSPGRSFRLSGIGVFTVAGVGRESFRLAFGQPNDPNREEVELKIGSMYSIDGTPVKLSGVRSNKEKKFGIFIQAPSDVEVTWRDLDEEHRRSI